MAHETEISQLRAENAHLREQVEPLLARIHVLEARLS